ncbi:ferritin-like domain-containing protein [Ilyomonas limi]|uniref:Ferritin-like domain-containing protein n=1 Tax=Ilyomonas limi TaxID=2575867 RepID=A0A4U3KZS0_9BACT|nr:ferritin-like domain-containing protein [Ilyomonas limi]TKK66696.1 ferritin-like domain-containing protein [Ilyomonas limi]
MNFNNIITEIEKIDPEVYDRLDNRRNAMQQFARIGGKLALTAIPLALGGMFKKAYAGGGGTMPGIVDVLNFALTLEYLEAEFYNVGTATSGLITDSRVMSGFMTIRDHENEHVAFLTATIKALGGTPVAKPTFDFTAGGAFSDVFSNADTFYAVSQTFEDTGVRAYKGQAGNLISSNEVLTAALQIHSVEARHASFVRSLRSIRMNWDESIRPWITGNSTSGIGAAVQATYAGEENTNQLGIEITNINGFDISWDDASEAFDEPLSMEAILTIVDPFIVS